MIRRLRVAPVLLPCLLLVVGCGGRPAGYASAYGKVSYQGEPAAGAVLFFHPAGQGAGKGEVVPSATVEEDGSFRVSSPGGDGALPGKYAVLVSWPSDASAADVPAGKKRNAAGKSSRERRKNKLDPQTSDRLKGRYFEAGKPLLTTEITAGSTDLGTFEIKD